MILNINTDALKQHTARLGKINRSALPVATRQALNKTAFDVKTNTMPMESNVFVHRAPTFFKATSKVDPAKGFDIKTMQATVGFLPQSGVKESGGATKDLEQQENSGAIAHRTFVPLKGARAGGSIRKRVLSKRTLAYINSRQSVATQSSIVDSLHATGKNKKQRFIKSAIAAGKGGFVLGTERRSGSRELLAIDSIIRIDGKTVVKSTPIYSVKSGRQVRVKATRFMRKASNMSAAKMEAYYIIEANKQIAKVR